MNIVSREEALRLGLKRFFTGENCIRGMIAERRTSDRACMCQACKRRIAEKNSDYRKSESNKDYYRRNRETILANEKARKLANPEKHREYLSAYRIKNADKIVQYRSVYHAENRGKSNVSSAARRSAKMRRTPVWFSDLDRFIIEEASSLALLRSELTGVEWEVDHMIPLQGKTASGLHVGRNIQVIPMSINRSKRNKMLFTNPFEWVSKFTKKAGQP